MFRCLLIIGALASMLLTTQIAKAQSSRYFGGYRCTAGCLKHAEGFNWAREHRVRELSQCAGPSLSHIQGCIVYLRDRMRDSTRDDSGQLIE